MSQQCFVLWIFIFSLYSLLSAAVQGEQDFFPLRYRADDRQGDT